MSAAVAAAHALLGDGQVSAAAVALRHAELSGDPSAARELAEWCVAGTIVRRDLELARSLLARAGDLGDWRSAATHRAWLAAGIGGTANWGLAMKLLAAAASHDPEAANELELIFAMGGSAAQAPIRQFEPLMLSDSPAISLFPGILSRVECEYLIARASQGLEPSLVIDAQGIAGPNPVRTARAAAFPLLSLTLLSYALDMRLAGASGTSPRSAEPLQVLAYAKGEQYRLHSDALPSVRPGDQRVLTFLVYLNDNYDGGETYFPNAGIKVKGRDGDGLLFANTLPDATPDPRAVHAGLPVIRGEKYLASRWIRATPRRFG